MYGDIMEIKDSDINQKVLKAIRNLIENDSYLLKNDVNERAITHRLALYLESEFVGWNVDCEYNRDSHDGECTSKRLPRILLSEAESDKDEKTVIPDIIVHHRGPGDNNNLLAIEVKTTTNFSHDRKDFDYRKLSAFKSILKYHCCLFIKFNTKDAFKNRYANIEDNAEIIWNPII